MLSSLFFLIIGFILLGAGAELLVGGSSRLALRLGVTPLVVGLTVVAFGTSAPELAVSIDSTLSGLGALALGNVIGSNIANIGLILGVTALIQPIHIELELVRKQIPIVIACSVMMGLLLIDGSLSRLDGVLLVSGLAVYLFLNYRQGRSDLPADSALPLPEVVAPSKPGNTWMNILFILAGLALLVAGSHIFVEQAISIARLLGISEAIIGLTLVAVGTSIPELATSVLAAFRRQSDIAIGNVVGSNTFNILCVLGLTVYTFFGTSTTLSVGPVAVLSLMTAAALGKLSLTDPGEIVIAAMALAFMSGMVLLILGLLRLGFMANFISHPVISAFVTASAMIIGFSQLRFLLGVDAGGENLIELLLEVFAVRSEVNYPTLALGVLAFAIIIVFKISLKKCLLARQVDERLATMLSRAGPVFAALVSVILVWVFGLDDYGVAVLAEVPAGLPDFAIPPLNFELIRSLWGSALLIAIIGFVESVSVARVMAARRQERINLDQELVGLGAANIASAMGGGYSVTGGFSRSSVNFEAGAATPAAGFYTALIVALVALLLTPALYWLPRVTLAAIIVMAILPLIDFSMLWKSWRYSKSDFVAVCLTLILTLAVGVEIGIAAGVLVSIFIHLYRTSQPHVAVVGRVAGTEHFRNIDRHKVETFDNLLSVRVDESLYFANSQYLEELIFELVSAQPKLRHVVLMCTAVNEIDLSALEALEHINDTLAERDIQLHLSEIKGPIMDKLGRTGFFKSLTGNNYMSHNQAVEDLRLQN